MVCVGVCFKDPVHLVTLGRDEREDGVGGLGCYSLCGWVVIKDWIDDDRGLCGWIGNNVLPCSCVGLEDVVDDGLLIYNSVCAAGGLSLASSLSPRK